jgi:hypothetical protein
MSSDNMISDDGSLEIVVVDHDVGTSGWVHVLEVQLLADHISLDLRPPGDEGWEAERWVHGRTQRRSLGPAAGNAGCSVETSGHRARLRLFGS